MLSRCRCWIAQASLALYLVVNIGAAALHHHLDRHFSTQVAPSGESVCQLQTARTIDHDGPCLTCQVLHLARTLPVVLHFDVRPGPVGQALSALPPTSPCQCFLSVQARAPPVAV